MDRSTNFVQLILIKKFDQHLLVCKYSRAWRLPTKRMRKMCELGPSLDQFGTNFEQFRLSGAKLVQIGARLGQVEPSWSPVGTKLESSWGQVGAEWGQDGPSWGNLAPRFVKFGPSLHKSKRFLIGIGQFMRIYRDLWKVQNPSRLSIRIGFRPCPDRSKF